MSSVEIKFPTEVQEFFDLLLKNVNEDFLLKGGAIHDLLQGKKPNDYDIVVASLSETHGSITSASSSFTPCTSPSWLVWFSSWPASI